MMLRKLSLRHLFYGAVCVSAACAGHRLTWAECNQDCAASPCIMADFFGDVIVFDMSNAGTNTDCYAEFRADSGSAHVIGSGHTETLRFLNQGPNPDFDMPECDPDHTEWPQGQPYKTPPMQCVGSSSWDPGSTTCYEGCAS